MKHTYLSRVRDIGSSSQVQGSEPSIYAIVSLSQVLNLGPWGEYIYPCSAPAPDSLTIKRYTPYRQSAESRAFAPAPRPRPVPKTLKTARESCQVFLFVKQKINVYKYAYLFIFLLDNIIFVCYKIGIARVNALLLFNTTTQQGVKTMQKSFTTYAKQSRILIERESKAESNLSKIVLDIVANLSLTRVTAILHEESTLASKKSFAEYVTRNLYQISGDIKNHPQKSGIYKKLNAVDIVTKQVLQSSPAVYKNEQFYIDKISSIISKYNSLNALLDAGKPKKESKDIPAKESNPVTTQAALAELPQLANPIDAMQVACNTIKMHMLESLESAPEKTKPIINELVDFLSNHITTLYGVDITSLRDACAKAPTEFVAFENNQVIKAVCNA